MEYWGSKTNLVPGTSNYSIKWTVIFKIFWTPYYLLTDLLTDLNTYLLTYSFTPWTRVLLEKLRGFQLVKKFPAFYGTRKFITANTSVRHLSLSCARSTQPMPPHPTS